MMLRDTDPNQPFARTDGGDCCGHDNDYKYCQKCACLDCTYKHKSDKCVKKIKGFCGKEKFQGDGVCDDKNNNAGCSWDDGDCCGFSGKVSVTVRARVRLGLGFGLVILGTSWHASIGAQ